ncbi:MAG TPA: ABC transporter permease [Puia sp.]|nr:ABC transporter permease [Puia sp.]
MLKNYWKIAIRNIMRSKGFSFLNITGLALGMASATLILLWMQHEISIDRWHAKDDRLYELMTTHFADGKLGTGNATPEIMAPAIKRDVPEVEDVIRVSWSSNLLFNYEDKAVKMDGVAVDTGFLTAFSFPLLKGDAQDALRDPYSIVLTETGAKKLFGTEDPIGKVVKMDNKESYKVSGVLKDLPDNTQFRFEWLMSYNFLTMKNYIDKDWTDVNNRAFLLLKPNTTAASVNTRLKGMIHRYSGGKTTTDAFIYPLNQVHLYSEFENGKPVGGRITTVRIFGLVATLILLIACINFMNLSTARSARRGKEVGIRKVVGARRPSLILQFLCESLLIAAIAGVLALIIVQWSLPAFGRLTDKHLVLGYANPYFWGAALLFIVITGMLAGSYPAFFLSSFRPATVLKGSFARIHALLTPRKVLVVAQFTIAVVLIVSSLIIARQVQYAESREKGYDQNNLIYVYMEGDIKPHYSSIKADLMASGAVTAISRMQAPLTETWSWGSGLNWEGKDPNAHIGFARSATSGGIVKAAGLTIVQGRDIDIDTYATDSTACLVNEAALKVMNLKDPIGQWVFDDPATWHIVGVFKDFILGNPYEPIKPFIIKGPKQYLGVMHIRLNGEHSTAQNLATMEKIFKTYNPSYPFEYHFIDADYAEKFKSEKRTGKLAGLFAGLTILISCLGLFGLAAYMAESRTKEIGIRKVLGASVTRISLLLSSGFIRLVLISIVIAVPISWYVMHIWLQGYTYRVGIEWWWFVMAGLGAVAIALIAVSAQSIRAAVANPIKSLRTE